MWAYVPIIPKEPKPGQQSVSIVSWNVDNFLVSRNTMLHSARYMRTLQPDIICLQERPHEVKVAWTDILDALPQHRHAVRNSHEDEVLNLAILSCHPIIATGERTFEGTYNKYLWADVATKADTLRIFCVHLQTTGISGTLHQAAKLASQDYDVSSSRFLNAIFGNYTLGMMFRASQANIIATEKMSSQKPVILCGDFNDVPYSYVYNTMLGDLVDGFKECGEGLMYTFTGKKIVRIDYIFHDESLEGETYYKKDFAYSDHYPVFMKIAF
jgi:endonuclease/exonuclease/phosphatase family metal-dependent hydrolase